MEEQRYQDFYRRHRFAATKRKGGWDATRHAEILAMGTVPTFAGLAEAPFLAVPFVPKARILRAEAQLLPYSKRLEAVYNATVHQLLDHTRRCLTAESMAARVLRAMGLWPTSRPLRLLYVTCGFGFTGIGDGWQGPVSIGIFLGLHALLRDIPGSRIVDAPAMDPNPEVWPETVPRSNFWYLARDSDPWIREEDLRYRMYGYGFSYARRLSAEELATQGERDGVPESLARHQFDGIIYGKVGPGQACDPLPFFDDVISAGYPFERVALIYGGDFGLETKQVAQHARIFSGHGLIFFREMMAPPAAFRWVPARVLPRACYADVRWKQFFQLWRQRLACWACRDVDLAVLQLWEPLRALSEGVHWAGAHLPPCWSGLVLLAVPVLADAMQAASLETRDLRCRFFRLQLRKASKRLSFAPRRGRWRLRVGAGAFREAFGVAPWEVAALVASACGGAANGGLFDARFTGDGRALRKLRVVKGKDSEGESDEP
ncbi:unnamed protein product [Effrenium voratum]|nr:unnamed protein product [Effrenium voratum]